MNILDVKERCIGCGACADSCPVSILELARDSKGFYVPQGNTEECIDCGKCVQACPLISPAPSEIESRSYQYGWINDPTIRQASTSGGAFSALSDAVMKKGGSVFGSAYTEDQKCVRTGSADDLGIDALRGTKYCQSYPDHIFRKVAEQLESGKPVMLVGTPCVIAAARKMFGKHEKLLLVDFFCGGVVPSSILRSYVEHMENRKGTGIRSMNMRDKSCGWKRPRILIRFKNGSTYSRQYHYDLFLHYYYTPYFKNEQCITCPFVKHNDADITIGDFWGFRKVKIENDDNGISLICANTEKGRECVEQIRGCMTLLDLPESAAAYAYKEKKYTTEQLKKRAEIQTLFHGDNFMEVAKSYDFKYGVPGIVLRQVSKKLHFRR